MASAGSRSAGPTCCSSESRVKRTRIEGQKSAYLLPNLLWTKRKTPDRMRHTNPTAMYATPRNGFFPPSHEVFEMMSFFVPLNDTTG